ncbi:hypothetical protein TVAG_317830 [Trichomonas vaginalis G3]|uniref:Uncharacterized protein n=1 Tax=Trichomonas vaginalis (strain ATCC PRA-98 / G3) TaxID=412133 RepID=A2F3N0_TRIV3|nr:mRNA 3'-end processing [Trichomonas vaginalis G3]EAY00498.1 hypothetical protein TVAG_317830 [Trichomonas vaginalis G3]KAI5520544.1 mRNA 3'-end processing [Trichomonas vaginalis G3]|eukprot:XP_001313427.1 hypothetical protein [Trichomonas vaginalis G3]
MQTTTTTTDPIRKRFDSDSEARFLLTPGQSITLSVDSGSVFYNGWQLPETGQVVFRDKDFTLMSYKDSYTLKFMGKLPRFYAAKRIPQESVPAYDLISQKSVVAVCGPPLSGKTTACQTIINSALHGVPQHPKEKPIPIYVNLDPAQAPFCPPGSIGALPITKPIDNTGFKIENPLTYFFGHTEIDEAHRDRYTDLVHELATYVKQRRQAISQSDGGVVIDLPSPTNEHVLPGIAQAIKDFEVTHIVCIGDDRLVATFQRSFPWISVWGMPALGAAHDDEISIRTAQRSLDTKRYFDGDDSADLVSMTYRFTNRDDFKLYKVDKREPEEVPISTSLMASVVAIVQRPHVSNELWKQNVLGYLTITKVQNEDNIEVLKPKQPLPNNVQFIIGSIKYFIK